MRHSSRAFPQLLLNAGLLAVALLAAAPPSATAEEPTPAATASFDAYTHQAEVRLNQQHASAHAFLVGTALSPDNSAKLHQGELIVEKLTPDNPADLPGAMLHHWRATAFAPNAKASDLERVLRDFDAYPRYFAPDVTAGKTISTQGDHVEASLRIRQKHGITVVLDTTYEVQFGQLDPAHRYSLSRSTKITEIEAAGTASEHAMTDQQAHGFLWRQDTYWTWEERDNGLYLQVESISLSRSIPTGLGWAIRPFVEAMPRESLEFTLRKVTAALTQ